MTQRLIGPLAASHRIDSAIDGGPPSATSSSRSTGMVHAAKIMATTAIDLCNDAKKRAEIRAEFAEQTKGFVYKPYIPDGPPPIPPR